MYQPHRELEYYIDLSKKAFELVDCGYDIVLRYVATHYLDFLAYVNKKGANRQDLLKMAKEEKIDTYEEEEPAEEKEG